MIKRIILAVAFAAAAAFSIGTTISRADTADGYPWQPQYCRMVDGEYTCNN
jgi:hypothetical protein